MMDLYDWVEQNVSVNTNIDVLTPREIITITQIRDRFPQGLIHHL